MTTTQEITTNMTANAAIRADARTALQFFTSHDQHIDIEYSYPSGRRLGPAEDYRPGIELGVYLPGSCTIWIADPDVEIVVTLDEWWDKTRRGLAEHLLRHTEYTERETDVLEPIITWAMTALLRFVQVWGTEQLDRELTDTLMLDTVQS